MSSEISIIEEYVCESLEHLAEVEGDFLLMEKGNTEDPEIINRIFRAVHTIKGGAGFLGCIKIQELSHTMETVLSDVRDGKISLSVKLSNVLLNGIDTLKTLFADIDGSNNHEIDSLIVQINDVVAGISSISIQKEREEQSTLRFVHSRTENFLVTKEKLDLLPSEHSFFYMLTYDLIELEKTKGYSPVQLVSELQKFGTIVDGFLLGKSGDVHNIDQTECLQYHVLFATVVDPEIIASAVELEDRHIQSVTKDQLVIVENGEVIAGGAQLASDELSPTKIVDNLHYSVTNKSTITNHTENLVNSDSIRIRLDVLDRLMMLAGELVLVRNQELMNVDRRNPVSRTISQRLDIVTSDLQETIMRTRMQPIGSIFGRFTRLVRDICVKLDKKIELELIGNDVELDKTILEALVDPLVHIVRNSCDHGIETPSIRVKNGKDETGTIVIRAYHEGGQVVVDISDNGRGIDALKVGQKAIEKGLKSPEEVSQLSHKELLGLIFLPGFSTADTVSDLSGRGVGMDVVKSSIEQLGGIVDIASEFGAGTHLSLRLPLTLAIIPSLIVNSCGSRYAIPQISLEELVCLYDEEIISQIECAGSREVYRLRDMLLPMVHLEEVFNHSNPITALERSEITERARAKRTLLHEEFLLKKRADESASLSLTFAVLKLGDSRFGLIIDEVIGTEEIVVKPMHRAVKDLTIYSGATVLGDGCVALILDILGIAMHAGVELEEQKMSGNTIVNPEKQRVEDLILFKSGSEEVFAVDMKSVLRVEKIATADIEHVGGIEFITVEGVSTRVLSLDTILPIAVSSRSPDMFLILPRKVDKPCGIIISSLVDIGSFVVEFNEGSYQCDGITGSAIIKNCMTLFLDLHDIQKRGVVC